MEIDTRSSEMALALAANSTATGTSISNPADQLQPTSPPSLSGVGIIPMGVGGAYSANGLQIVPFGVGSNTNTFLLSIFGWDFIRNPSQQVNAQWTAWLLASFTCTLSSSITGIAGGAIPATSYYCDTISLNKGNANVSNEIISPTGGVKASITLDAKGARYVQLSFAMNASATSANALWRRL